MALTDEQNRTLEIVERSASVLSVFGIATIIGTFALSPHFRNPIHRLVLINAFYNLFDVTATLISVSGPAAGNSSALCQFQGFLMQMFPLADVLWTLAMACNVFMIVFYRHDAAALRKLERIYIGVITALVFIPAFTFLFIHTPERGPMYGSVTLWCSISPNWVLFRILFFYGPIWLIIAITMILYCLVGVEILKRRHAFKFIASDSIPLDTVASANSVPLDHSKSGEAMTAEVSAQSQSERSASTRDGNESVFASKYSVSTPHQRPSENGQTHRSALSFKQYILLPLMFFVVLLAIWVAPTTNRVSAFINPNNVSYPLLLAVGATGSLRGFWNGVVFITVGMKARKTRKELEKRTFSRV